jgi:hypothetical protein
MSSLQTQLFSAFSPLNGGSLGTYNYASESPFDLDAGLDYTRQSRTISPWPFPVLLGYVEGVIPLHNNLEYNIMRGKTPFGPWTGQQSAPVQMVFPNIMGSLAKVSG